MAGMEQLPQTIQPLHAALPRVDAGEVRAMQIAGLAGLGNPAWRSRVRRSRQSDTGGCTVSIDSAFGSLQLRVDAGHEALVACAAMRDAPLRDAVATLLTQPLADAWFGQECRLTARVTDEATGTNGDPGWGVSVLTHCGSAQVLHASSDLVESLSRAVETMRPAFGEVLARCGSLPVDSSLVIGRVLLADLALKRLRAGDILLIGPQALAGRDNQRDGISAEVIWCDMQRPHLRATGAYRNHTMTLESSAELVCAATPNDTSIFAKAVEQLELQVVVTLDAPTLTLTEIAALEPGAVLALPGDPGSARVSLSAGGNVFGDGQLVAVGNHLGVRIETLSLAPVVARAATAGTSIEVQPAEGLV